MTGQLILAVIGVLVAAGGGWLVISRHDRRVREQAEAKRTILITAKAEQARMAQAAIPRPDRAELDDKLGKGQF